MKTVQRDMDDLDIRREEANGTGKRMLDAMRREAGFYQDQPQRQREIHEKAAQRVRAEVASYDPNTSSYAQRGDNPKDANPRPNPRPGPKPSRQEKHQRAKAMKELGEKKLSELTPEDRKRLGF